MKIRGVAKMIDGLGGFGDLRLQKGGPFCGRGLSRLDRAVCVFGGWAGIGPVRSA
jgi:hypothetical protein